MWEKMNVLTNHFSLLVGTRPREYLGPHLGGNPGYSVFWDSVVEKVEKRLAGWKRAFLSKGEKLTLSLSNRLFQFIFSVYSKFLVWKIDGNGYHFAKRDIVALVKKKRRKG